MSWRRCSVFAWLALAVAPAFGVPKKLPAAPSPSEIVSSMPEPEAPSVQITTFVGVHALTGKNAALGARFGVRYPKKKDLFIGPEVLVAPSGQSSVVYLLLTAEQQINLAQGGRITGGGVLWAGVAFPQDVPGVGDQALAFGTEFFVSRRIDELARLRMSARLGLVAGRATVLGAIGVSFRL